MNHKTPHKISLPTLLLLGALPLTSVAVEYAQAPAGAQPVKEQTPAPLFEQLDVNHDGLVTVEEAKRSAEVTARFKDLDTNRDARISADEFRKGMQEKM